VAQPWNNPQVSLTPLKERSHTDEKGYKNQEGSNKRIQKHFRKGLVEGPDGLP
jgi:hypothetical protein